MGQLCHKSLFNKENYHSLITFTNSDGGNKVSMTPCCFMILIPGELGLIHLQMSIGANSALQQEGCWLSRKQSSFSSRHVVVSLFICYLWSSLPCRSRNASFNYRSCIPNENWLMLGMPGTPKAWLSYFCPKLSFGNWYHLNMLLILNHSVFLLSFCPLLPATCWSEPFARGQDGRVNWQTEHPAGARLMDSMHEIQNPPLYKV